MLQKTAHHILLLFYQSGKISGFVALAGPLMASVELRQRFNQQNFPQLMPMSPGTHSGVTTPDSKQIYSPGLPKSQRPRALVAWQLNIKILCRFFRTSNSFVNQFYIKKKKSGIMHVEFRSFFNSVSRTVIMCLVS